MNTIKNYLESMFAQLPNTPEVWKAKDELWQMMEDRYTDLIADGKTENEAVGAVIAEFGNLDELAETLGIRGAMNQAPQYQASILSASDAFQLIKDKSRASLINGIAVLLFICSVMSPVVFSSLSIGENSGTLGVVGMFVMIAVGVGLEIYQNTMIGKWKYIHNQPCQIDADTANQVYNEMESFRGTAAIMKMLAVVLLVLCVTPTILSSTLQDAGYRSSIGVVFMFLLIGLGVMILVAVDGREKAYKELVNLNPQSTIAGSYVPNYGEDVIYHSTAMTAFMQVFWPTVTCIYLSWSFLTFDWHISWVIWPIAGIIFALLKNLFGTEVRR